MRAVLHSYAFQTLHQDGLGRPSSLTLHKPGPVLIHLPMWTAASPEPVGFLRCQLWLLHLGPPNIALAQGSTHVPS